MTNNTFLQKITVSSRLPFYNNATAKAMEQETYNKDLPDAAWAYSYGQYGLYRSVVFLWVEGGVRIMAARDSLLVLYITVTLLVVTLQEKSNQNEGQPQQNSNKKKYYRFDRVCLCKYVCRGGLGGMEEYVLLFPVCIPVLCYTLWSFKRTVEVIAWLNLRVA